jgi:phosphonate transport system permease protein
VTPGAYDASAAALALHLEETRATLVRQRRRTTLIAGVCLAAVFGVSLSIAEVDPAGLAAGLPRLFSYFGRITPELGLTTLRTDLGEWFWRWPVWIELMLETILIAALATVASTVSAGVLCFLAARNLVPRWVSAVTRRCLEFFRTVPELVFALLFVFAFGIGPMAGFLALAVHGAGTLGKLFAEVAEASDPGPAEALTAMGGRWPAKVRFGVMPQILPNMASYTMLNFESNVRSASVVGFVGGGGIGQELLFAIKQFQYTDVSALLLMIIVTVMLIDMASGFVRRTLIDGRLVADD